MTEKQYIAKTTGQPVPGVTATTPDGLPTIDNYDDIADLPLVYNELAASSQAALVARMKSSDPSATSTNGFRRIIVGTAAPTPADGVDGDVYFQTV